MPTVRRTARSPGAPETRRPVWKERMAQFAFLMDPKVKAKLDKLARRRKLSRTKTIVALIVEAA